MEVGRVRKGELPLALALWRENFSDDWELRGTDIRRIARLFSSLLSCGRLPLSLLHRLGVHVEVWVLRDRGEVVGVVGQIGHRIPYLIGLVVKRGSRGFATIRGFLDGVCRSLAAEGFRFARALVPAAHPVTKLALRLGWEAIGEVREYRLDLKGIAGQHLVASGARELKRGEEERMARQALASGDLRTLLSLERNYGSRAARLLGFRDLFLVPADGGEGIVAISANQYQRTATVRSFHGCDLDLLLRAALALLKHWGKEQVGIGLLSPPAEAEKLLENLGAAPQGTWLQLVRDLRG